MNDDQRDLREILASAERPRALTEDEEQRILARLSTGAEAVADRRPPSGVEVHPVTARTRVRSRVGSWGGWVVGGVAAISLLFVFVALREPTRPEPVLPLDTVPSPTLPASGAAAEFCTDHVDDLSNAIERWRGIENWAFTRGEPDIGQLADDALAAASAFDDVELADRAAAARDRLREALDRIDPDLADRDAIAPRVAAVDDALSTVVAIAGNVVPPCDVARLSAARELG